LLQIKEARGIWIDIAKPAICQNNNRTFELKAKPGALLPMFARFILAAAA